MPEPETGLLLPPLLAPPVVPSPPDAGAASSLFAASVNFKVPGLLASAPELLVVPAVPLPSEAYIVSAFLTVLGSGYL